MRNEKKLLSLPVSAPPDVVIENKIEKVKRCYIRGFYTREIANFKYSVELLEDEVIMLTVFDKDDTAIFRTFTSRNQYVSQYLDDNNKRSETKLGNRFGDYEYRDSVFVTDKANEDVINNSWLKSFKEEGETGFDSVASFQRAIGERRIKERNDRIRKSIDDFIRQIKPLPKDFDKWIDDIPLKESRYIMYQYANRKPLAGYCTHCKTHVQVEGVKHKTKGICPNCKSKVTFLAKGRTPLNFSEYSQVAYIQLGKERELIFRYFDVTRCYARRGDDLNHYTTYHEHAREFYYARKCYKWGNFRQTGEYRFCDTYEPHIEAKAHIYYKNIKSVFTKACKANHLKYIPFANFLKNSGKISVINFFIDSVRTPAFEYLIKLRLYKVVSDFINGYYTENINLEGKTFSQVLGVRKEDLPHLQKYNIGLGELKVYKIIKQYDFKAVGKAIEYCREQGIGAGLLMAKATKHTSFYKALKYVDEQTKKYNAEHSSAWYHHRHYNTLWKDYIENCILLGYDIKNDFVLFPKNLLKSHDDTMKLVRQDNTIFNKAISALESDLNKRYYFCDRNFLMRAPKDADEIVREGHKLHHCVGTGSYIEEMAKGKTVILFVRETKRPEKPFYTMEVSESGEILQLRGYSNKPVVPKLQKFIDDWQKKKLNKNIKVKVAV